MDDDACLVPVALVFFLDPPFLTLVSLPTREWNHSTGSCVAVVTHPIGGVINCLFTLEYLVPFSYIHIISLGC
jgi:hypothetical protein